MKKIWVILMSILASTNNANANIYETVMSFDEDTINRELDSCEEDEVMQLEKMLSEFEFLQGDDREKAAIEIQNLIKSLIERGILRAGATFVCAICQGGK